MMNIKGKLFLIPNTLAPDNPDTFLSEMVRNKVKHLTHFIVETEKDARALIKRLQLDTPQQQLSLFKWNEHSNAHHMTEIISLLEGGINMGIITDAGLPCIADPGSDIVAQAHARQIQVVPLPGASSIFMALMASGMNGQGFCFHGYLPIDNIQRGKKIKQLESDAVKNNQSQLFMEAPYRNNQLLAEILKQCNPETKLCIACNISSQAEFIQTHTIKVWKQKMVDLHKKPTIFIIG
jgi:16S rRNA (cytidine1402-2'-O)-methyltransferase